MKRAFKWGSIIIVCGLIISGIAYLGHKQPFDPMTPIEESTANHDVLTRKSFNKIKVTASSADVIIKQGNHFTVSYYGNKSHAVHAQVKDGVLKISQAPVTHSKLAKFQLLNNTDEDRCIVTIPQKADLTNIEGHVNNELLLNRVLAKKINLESNSGNINVLNCEFDQGKIITTSGDISIRNSALINTKLASTSGDINLNKVSLTKGTSSLTSGDFNGRRLTVIGHYSVTNQSGDNSITKSTIDGAKLTTKNGDNKLKRKHRSGGSLEQHTTEPNVIYLKNVSGNNIIK
ncbi:MAG: DUF4097 domain-containing protein [Lactobacillus sp.]|nr:DUF4097 domain-containing protein [Lactobacillus sp.]